MLDKVAAARPGISYVFRNVASILFSESRFFEKKQAMGTSE